MADWRHVFIIAPSGERIPTVLKGHQLPAALLYHLGNQGYSIELAGALSNLDAHAYNLLHNQAKASPTFGWYPGISSGEEP